MKALFHCGEIKQHPHYVYVAKQKPISSHDKPINSKLKDKLNIVQNFQHVVKTGSFKKQILKNYLEGEFNYIKF